MDAEKPKILPTPYKIVCKNYPSEFILDKNVAKEYFKQFGKVRRMVFKPKQRICTVDYADKQSFIEALNNAGEYEGQVFKVRAVKIPEIKKKKVTERRVVEKRALEKRAVEKRVIEKVATEKRAKYIDNDEIKSELEAMGGISSKILSIPEVIDLTDSLTETPKIEKVSKLKRSWMKETPTKLKKMTRTKEKLHTAVSPEQLELINLVKSQATTIEEKYRVLDARDKLIRMKLKKSVELKSSPTIGTCPDMCPEKERLMRETQHQVALYEQEDNGRTMNQFKAVKQYSRSSADQEVPLPHDLRPVSVLQMTMGYLMHNIIDLCDSNDVNLAEWFHFLWDRTRGIRKDITQQELCSQGAVELVEQCARFHIHCSARLVAEDPSVFDQKINTENLTKCLQTLKYMYHDLQLKGESCPNEAEFRAYIILLNLNDGNFMWEVQELREEVQKSKEVKFALQVYSALDKNNYVKFFKLVYSTSYLNACILMRYFVQVRIMAIKTLLKCYKPRAFRTVYPLNDLTRLLAFEDLESTIDFMQAYGLSINEEKTHIILEKNTFALPEFPYVLDRSLNVVESKRTCSIGKMVCGKELPPKLYEKHIPQNSFDASGRLIFKELLEESDLEQPKVKVEDSDSADMIETIPNPSDNLFAKKQESGPGIFASKTISTQSPKDSVFGSIFAQAKQEQAKDSAKEKSIFGQLVDSQRLAFITKQPSLFSGKVGPSSQDQTDSLPTVLQDQTGLNLWSKPATSIFAKKPQTTSSIFAKPATKSTSIFGGTIAEGVVKSAPTAEPKKGGFTFNLPKTTEPKVPSIFTGVTQVTSSPFPGLLSSQDRTPSFAIKMPITPEEPAPMPQPTPQDTTDQLEELRRRKEQEEQEKMRRELEEQQRKKDLEKKLREEEEKRREEERLREMKRKKLEEELKRKMEELRREEERLKELEIRNTVKMVLDEMVIQVDHKICEEKLKNIRDKIQKRMMSKMAKRWRQIVLKNKRKRKAMDCSPVWVNTKTLKQSAEELHTSSQELTLKMMKRYKYGKPLEIGMFEEEKITKINLFELTFPTLNRRFFDLRHTLQKHIFWKVEISLPDHYELRNGLNRIEDTLKDALQWEERNGTIMLVEQAKPNPAQCVTYCIARQRGLYARYADANGIIFVAKDFNVLLQRRIFENLKNFGVFTKVPIVIILESYDETDCKLKALIDENIVSDYLILIENLSPSALISLIEEGLVFLAGKVEKPPPLELDTMNAFITKHLCTEIWRRANSFAKWNSHYKTCLRNPNIVISLYNEGLAKLRKIILNKSCFEYATFPEVFKEYLESEIPDYLPCNYYYFPNFWKSETYIRKLEKVLNDLGLPSWQEKWPPSNELDLEVNVSKYCTKAFKEPEKPFYKVMSVLLRDVDPNANFEDISKVLWTDVIEVLGLEKLKEADLNLVGTIFETKSIFNQIVVVYDIETLENYSRSDWFYINNPLVKKHVKQQLKEVRRAQVDLDRKETKLELDLNIDLDKTISDVTNQLLNKQNNLQMRKELAEFNALLDDLETSIKIHKKISSKLDENLKNAIKDN